MGRCGVVASGAVLGLTDVDALTISMSRAAAIEGASVAARAIAVGILSNTALKLSIVLIVGRGTFRGLAATGLLAMALAFGVGIWLLR